MEPQPQPQPQPGPMSVVFFDVDGVLNTTAPDSPSLGIEPPLLANLLTLASQQPTLVVLSSDWRRRPDLTERARLAVEQVGLQFGGVVEPRLSKPDAIKLWLSHHGSTLVNWLAIDDHDLEGVDMATVTAGTANRRSEAATPSVFGGHFLRTDDAVGLTAECAAAGAAMLSTLWERRTVDLARMKSARHLPLEEEVPQTIEKRLRCDDCGAELVGPKAAQEHMESARREQHMVSHGDALLGLLEWPRKNNVESM